MASTVGRHFHDFRGADENERQPLIVGEMAGLPTKDSSQDEVDNKRAMLAGQAQMCFDATSEEHIKLLMELWILAFDEPFERRGERWGELGFQSKDPVSDLRGAGHMALSHLTSFLATVGRSFIAQQPANFPLSLASFSCTAMLCRYLRLHPTIIFPGCDDHHASPSTRGNFFRLHAQCVGRDVLQLIHARLLQRLAQTWERMQTPTTTIMDFQIALRSTFTHLHQALTATPRPWQLSTLVETLDRKAIDRWEMLEACNPGVCQSLTLTLLWMLATRLTCRDRYAYDEDLSTTLGQQSAGVDDHRKEHHS